MARAQHAMSLVRDQIGTLRSRIRASQADVAGEAGTPAQIGPGDQVWLADVDTWGTVLSVQEEDQIEVQVGQTRVRLSLTDAEKVRPPAGKRLPERSAVTRKVSGRAPALEVDFRGKRADEVTMELDRYLNDASLAGLSRVRVIHGFGTGVLRRVVREMLASHSLVRSFRPGERGEGGDGVTMVDL